MKKIDQIVNVIPTRFRDRFTFTIQPIDCETNNEPSVTVPGQAYTIEELLVKFGQGQNPVSVKDGIYYGEAQDFDDFDPTTSPDFDLVDAENTLNQIKNRQKFDTENENIQNTTLPQNTQPLLTQSITAQKSDAEVNLAGSEAK